MTKEGEALLNGTTPYTDVDVGASGDLRGYRRSLFIVASGVELMLISIAVTVLVVMLALFLYKKYVAKGGTV